MTEPTEGDLNPFAAPPVSYVQLDPLAQRAAQRRRATIILSVVSAVVLVVAAVAALTLNHKSSPSSSAGGATAPAGQGVAPSVLSAVTGVPSSVVTSVGSGSSTFGVKAIPSGGPVSSPKPSVLFVGGEFCPYCAAERWSIIQAFSRFGSFTGLAQIRSSEGNLPTFDFASAHYTSKYVGLAAVEIIGQNHEPLQKLTRVQQAVFKKYSQDESFPFLYFNGKYVQDGAGYDPELLAGLTQQQVAAQLRSAASPLTRGIVGEANVLTAAICDIDGDAPGSVCSNPAVSALQQKVSGAIEG